ncbi:MAG: FtsH protease activity modulator HflK [Desulfomonilaceae bacterium]
MDQFRPRNDQSPVHDLQRGVEDLKDLVDRFLRGRGTWVVILALIALYLSSGVYVVGPGEKGVVLLFGKLYSLADPGLRYRLPRPFMSQTIVDIASVRSAEIGYRSDGTHARSIPAESMMLTGDENIVDVQLFVQYMVQDPVKFLYGAKDPVNTLRASAEVALRGVVGEKDIDYTMVTGRTEVQEKVKANLQKLLDNYNTGLLVTQAGLREVDAPTQVREAFHDVLRAWEDRARLIQEAQGVRADVIPKARGQAQQEILEAEAYKAQRVIRARGDAQRFTDILAEYAKSPKVTRERLYLESVEKFLPNAKKVIMEGGSNTLLPFLPLGPQEANAGTGPGIQGPHSRTEKKGQ